MKFLQFMIFVWMMLHTYGAAAQDIDCTNYNIPKHFDLLVVQDQSCVAQQGGVANARANIKAAMDAAIANLNTAFAGYNITFSMVLFPDKVFENGIINGNDIEFDRLQKVKKEFYCVPYHGMVVFSGNTSSNGYTLGGVSFIGSGSMSSSLLTHEIGHQIFGGGHTENTPCAYACTNDWMTSNFMCHTGSNTTLTSCQSNYILNDWLPNYCQAWLHHSDPLPDDYACPDWPEAFISTDQPYLIRGCDKDRSTLMVNVTITGSEDEAVQVAVRPKFNDHHYDFDLATMGMDFNAVQVLNPGLGTTQLKVLDNPTGPFTGQQTLFTVQPNETRTFMFKLKYNPEDSTSFIQSGIGSLKIIADVDIFFPTSTSVYLHPSVAPQPVMPLAPNALFTTTSPVIVSSDFNIPSDGVNPFNWSSPFTLVKKDVGINVGASDMLTINNIPVTTFEGCGGMWKGINVANGGTVEMKKTVLKDARAGVDITASAGVVSVQNTVFENDDIGIRINGAGAGAPTLAGLTFTQTAPLKKKATAQDPAPSFIGLAGIKATNGLPLTVSIDPTLGFSAKFEHIQHGIFADHTDVTIDHGFFSDLITESSGSGAGIRTSSCNPAVQGCSFEKVRVGIRSYKGILSATDNFMMEADSAISVHLINLTAIRNIIKNVKKTGIGGRLGIATIQDNTITGAPMGIGFNGTSLVIEENTLSKVNTGIKTTLCNNQKIRNNTIDASDYGIAFYQQNAVYGTSVVENNTITMEGNDNGVGINTGGSALFPHYGGTLLNNTIALKQGQAGIKTTSARAMDLVYNHISLDKNDGNAYGIRMEDNDLMTVTDNDITGHTQSENAAQRGIYGMHTCRSQFSCNFTDNTAYGFNFAGECSGKKAIQFSGNTLFNHNNGLLLGLPPANGNAIIGEQEHHQNKWAGSYAGPGALHLGDQFLASQSLFTADDQADDEYIPDVYYPIQWFDNQPGDNGPFACAFRPAGDGGIKQDIRIASGLVSGSNDGGALQWLAQRRLYERLTEEDQSTANNTLHNGVNAEWFTAPDIKTEEGAPSSHTAGDGGTKEVEITPEVATFMSDAAGSDLGVYTALQTGLRALYQTATTDQQVLDGYDSSLRDKSSLLKSLYAELNQPGITTGDQQQILNKIAQVNSEVVLQNTDRENLLNNIQQQRIGTAQTLLNALPVLNSMEVYKANEHTLYRIALELAAANAQELSLVQVSDLEAVATQCPITGGDAVLRARALLQQYSDATIRYNDDESCKTEQRPGERTALSGTPSITAAISPNPADETIRVSYQIDTDQDFILTDATGRIVRQLPLLHQQTTALIPITDLPSGIYFYCIAGLTPGKIAIQHTH